MAPKPSSKPINLRLRPVLLAYLDDLDRIGGFGKGRAGIVRQFLEKAIARELKAGMLEKKNAGDLGEKIGDDSDEDDDK
jgi:hypothetical protein